MIVKRIVFVIAASLFIDASILARSEGTEKDIITGTVIAYDLGLVRSGGSCWQHLVVRITDKDKQRQSGNNYIVVLYETSCLKLIPERLLKIKQQWRFSLTRKVNCDRTLQDLLYTTDSIGPPEKAYRRRNLKFVTGAQAEEIAKDATLPCYVLEPGEFEAPLKERLITGLVVRMDGHPVVGANVRLRYDDAFDYVLVKADEQGRFEIPIYEGFKYVVEAGVGNRGQKVKIPASGEIKPLRLVIK